MTTLVKNVFCFIDSIALISKPSLYRFSYYLLSQLSVLYGSNPGSSRGWDVQAAINAAQCGDTIALQAGATFRQCIASVLAIKAARITSLSHHKPAGIPAALSTYPNNYSGGSFTRITPAMAANMPKIVANGGEAALYFVNNSHHWKM